MRRPLATELFGARRSPGLAQPGLTPTGQWQTLRGGRAGSLTYLDVRANPPENAIVPVPLGPISKAHLQDIGKARFDTIFVRSLFFITNVVRLTRLKLHRELTQSRAVLVASHAAVAPGVTEYGADPFTPNEVLGSALPNGFARFNDAPL